MPNTNTFEDDERYKDWDFSNAKPANNHPLVQKLQERHAKAMAQQIAFDDDILEWISTQDDETRNHINEVVRHFMAVKQHA